MATSIIPIEQSTRLASIGAVANEKAAGVVFAEYRQRKAANTLARQQSDLDAFAAFLESFKIKITADALASTPAAWAGVTHGLIMAFVQQQLGLGFAMRTVNFRLSTVRVYCALAARAGVVPADEISMIRGLRGYSRREGVRIDSGREVTRVGSKKIDANIVPADVVDALLTYDDRPATVRNAAMIALMVDHGLRVGEVVGLQTDNIRAGSFVFYRQKVDKTQTHAMTARLRAIMAHYVAILPPPQPGPLIRRVLRNGELGQSGLSRQTIEAILKKLGRAHGIRNLSPHDLRHTWATAATAAGTPIDRLVDAGGWSSPVMPLTTYIAPAAVANAGVVLEKDRE